MLCVFVYSLDYYLYYQQIGNMGVWQHPDGSKHIVARDHGYDNDVESAYKAARKNHVDAEDKRRY